MSAKLSAFPGSILEEARHLWSCLLTGDAEDAVDFLCHCTLPTVSLSTQLLLAMAVEAPALMVAFPPNSAMREAFWLSIARSLEFACASAEMLLQCAPLWSSLVFHIATEGIQRHDQAYKARLADVAVWSSIVERISVSASGVAVTSVDISRSAIVFFREVLEGSLLIHPALYIHGPLDRLQLRMEIAYVTLRLCSRVLHCKAIHVPTHSSPTVVSTKAAPIATSPKPKRQHKVVKSSEGVADVHAPGSAPPTALWQLPADYAECTTHRALVPICDDDRMTSGLQNILYTEPCVAPLDCVFSYIGSCMIQDLVAVVPDHAQKAASCWAAFMCAWSQSRVDFLSDMPRLAGKCNFFATPLTPPMFMVSVNAGSPVPSHGLSFADHMHWLILRILEYVRMQWSGLTDVGGGQPLLSTASDCLFPYTPYIDGPMRLQSELGLDPQALVKGRDAPMFPIADINTLVAHIHPHANASIMPLWLIMCIDTLLSRSLEAAAPLLSHEYRRRTHASRVRFLLDAILAPALRQIDAGMDYRLIHFDERLHIVSLAVEQWYNFERTSVFGNVATGTHTNEHSMWRQQPSSSLECVASIRRDIRCNDGRYTVAGLYSMYSSIMNDTLVSAMGRLERSVLAIRKKVKAGETGVPLTFAIIQQEVPALDHLDFPFPVAAHVPSACAPTLDTTSSIGVACMMAGTGISMPIAAPTSTLVSVWGGSDASKPLPHTVPHTFPHTPAPTMPPTLPHVRTSSTPTHFLCVRLLDAALWSSLSALQGAIVAECDAMRIYATPIPSCHITLGVFNMASPGDLELASACLQAASSHVQALLDTHTHLHINGLDVFGNKVLFARPAMSPALQAVIRASQFLSEVLQCAGFSSKVCRRVQPPVDLHDMVSQAVARQDAVKADVKPHVTLFKRRYPAPQHAPKVQFDRIAQSFSERCIGTCPLYTLSLNSITVYDKVRGFNAYKGVWYNFFSRMKGLQTTAFYQEAAAIHVRDTASKQAALQACLALNISKPGAYKQA
jgi:hypothetical protein